MHWHHIYAVSVSNDYPMENQISIIDNALQKIVSLKLKMLIEEDLRNFRMLKQEKFKPAKATQLVAA